MFFLKLGLSLCLFLFCMCVCARDKINNILAVGVSLEVTDSEIKKIDLIKDQIVF